jgi:hypothetical protein
MPDTVADQRNILSKALKNYYKTEEKVKVDFVRVVINTVLFARDMIDG